MTFTLVDQTAKSFGQAMAFSPSRYIPDDAERVGIFTTSYQSAILRVIEHISVFDFIDGKDLDEEGLLQIMLHASLKLDSFTKRRLQAMFMELPEAFSGNIGRIISEIQQAEDV